MEAFLMQVAPIQFVCALLFGAFLVVRQNKWFWAATLASLSTVVRPLGFVALVGIGITLLRKHEYKKFVVAVVIGLAIGAAYAWPLWMHFGDPWATVHSYQQPNQPGPALFGMPFHAIIVGTFMYPAPRTNLILSFGWILFVHSECNSDHVPVTLTARMLH